MARRDTKTTELLIRTPIHQQIFDQLGPAALEVYQTIESMADENGVLPLDLAAIVEAINARRKEQAQ